MKPQIRWSALALVGSLGLTVLTPTSALAGREGRRNTAVVLGAAAVYGVVKKKPELAGIAGAGAIYSFVRSQHPERKRRRPVRRVRRVVRPAYVAAPAAYRRSDDGQENWKVVKEREKARRKADKFAAKAAWKHH
jgi:hypothetical protein